MPAEGTAPTLGYLMVKAMRAAGELRGGQSHFVDLEFQVCVALKRNCNGNRVKFAWPSLQISFGLMLREQMRQAKSFYGAQNILSCRAEPGNVSRSDTPDGGSRR
jgi:hypothetical protein